MARSIILSRMLSFPDRSKASRSEVRRSCEVIRSSFFGLFASSTVTFPPLTAVTVAPPGQSWSV